MSVENFDGNGLVDQPSIIYSFQPDDSAEVGIRELARSGFGEPGASPGDVIERETTKSNPTDGLPELDLPGQGGLARDDCGNDIPAFACLGDEDCGKSVYVGRTCANPTCERDWPAAVKRNVVRNVGKFETLRFFPCAHYDEQNEMEYVIPLMRNYGCNPDDPAKAKLTHSTGSTYLNIPYIASTQVQQELRNQRRKKPHNHNEHSDLASQCSSWFPYVLFLRQSQ